MTGRFPQSLSRPPRRLPVAAAPAPAPCVLFSRARRAGAFWRTLRAIEDHWIGDLIGVTALAVMLIAGLFIAHGVTP